MNVILNLVNWLVPLLYLGLLIDYGSTFFLRTRTRGRPLALTAVLAVHVVCLALWGLHQGRAVPVSNWEVLAVVAAATAGLYCIVEWATRDRRTGVFVILAVFLMQYTAAIVLPHTELPETATEPQRPWACLHVLPAIVAYTALMIAAIYGVLHLLARRDLKRHRFGLLFDRLPPLERLGLMNTHAMLAGFIFMTLSIVSGMLLLDRTGLGSGPFEAKILVKILAGSAAWVIFGVALGGRWLWKWDYARMARVTLAGFVLVVAILIASILLTG